jgi:hypothetical protein
MRFLHDHVAKLSPMLGRTKDYGINTSSTHKAFIYSVSLCPWSQGVYKVSMTVKGIVVVEFLSKYDLLLPTCYRIYFESPFLNAGIVPSTTRIKTPPLRVKLRQCLYS